MLLGNHCLAVFCAQSRNNTDAKTICVRFYAVIKTESRGYSLLNMFSNVGMQTISFNPGEHFLLEKVYQVELKCMNDHVTIQRVQQALNFSRLFICSTLQ